MSRDELTEAFKAALRGDDGELHGQQKQAVDRLMKAVVIVAIIAIIAVSTVAILSISLPRL